MNKQDLIPNQEVGKHLDLSETRDYLQRSDAENSFQRISAALLQPQQWKALCGDASAEFAVVDEQLQQVERSIQVGDFLRIDIPGPGPDSGDGYDWVRVAMIVPEKDDLSWRLSIKLEPVNNPEGNDDKASHFFKEGSSSTLQVLLIQNKIEVQYHGRNEVINNDTGKLVEDIRNTVVGAGAKAGLSKAQWSALLKGLISEG